MPLSQTVKMQLLAIFVTKTKSVPILFIRFFSPSLSLNVYCVHMEHGFMLEIWDQKGKENKITSNKRGEKKKFIVEMSHRCSCCRVALFTNLKIVFKCFFVSGTHKINNNTYMMARISIKFQIGTYWKSNRLIGNCSPLYFFSFVF